MLSIVPPGLNHRNQQHSFAHGGRVPFFSLVELRYALGLPAIGLFWEKLWPGQIAVK
jgi:hypothetical protein